MKPLLCLILVFWCSVTHAHDLWIERTADGLTLFQGHRHSQHEGVELIEYSTDVIVRAECFGDDATKEGAALTATYPFLIPEGCAAVFVLTSTGYWTKTPFGTKNVSKKDATSPIKSWLSFESVKRIDRWSESLARPLTGDLELVSLVDPLGLNKGRKLRLLVTFDGRPAEGITVTYDGKPIGVTGPDGQLNIKIRHDGFQVIQASLHIPQQSELADEIIHTTNLNFETGAER